MTTIENIAQTPSAEEAQEPDVRDHLVWDLPVRIFHWTLAAAIAAAYVTNWLGISYFKYHVWCGYLIIVLVSFQLIWGLIGTRHALFHNFVRGPAELLGMVVVSWWGSRRTMPATIRSAPGWL